MTRPVSTPAEISAFARDRRDLRAVEWRDGEDKLVARQLAVACVMRKGSADPRRDQVTVRIAADDIAGLMEASS